MRRETIRELLLVFGTLCLIAAVVLSGFVLTSCDDRKTVVCNDGTISSGAHVDPALCNAHGGVRP